MMLKVVSLGVLTVAGLATLSACSSSPRGDGYSDAGRYRPECSTASSCSGSDSKSTITDGDEYWFKDRGS